MSGLIAGLSGANGAASNAQGYYGNAASQLSNQYQSPAANMFSKEFISSLQPGFQQQQQGLLGNLAAHGITNSGAAKADLTNLYTGESGAEAAGVAPLYQQALGQYGDIIGQEPGAELGAYNQANQDLYSGLGGLSSLAGELFGLPLGGGGGGDSGGGNPYGGTRGQGGNY